MSDSFSKNLTDKLQKAKNILHAQQDALGDLPSVSSGSTVPDVFRVSSVTSSIETKLDTRNVNKLGILAFFNRKGEEARSKLARVQGEHAEALLSLETARQASRSLEFQARNQDNDLVRAKLIQVAQSHAQLVMVQQQIEFLNIQTRLAIDAGNRGYDFATDQELRKKEAEIEHELHKIDGQSKIEVRDFEEKERIKFEYEQKRIDAETDATIRLANTEHLNRAQMLALIADYDQKIKTTTSERMKKNYKREIKRLEGELTGNESGGMAGQTDAGKTSKRGDTTSEPGDNS